MSGVSKANEYPTISDLFCLLDKWRHLPNYQLERRADAFFALFLPEVLKKKCGIKIKQQLLIPEFPIDKNKNDRGHKQVDYFALSEDGRKGILVELKTDSASKNKKQEEMLRRVASEKSLKCLLEDVIEIAQYKKGDSRQRRQKYVHLLLHLRSLGLVTFDSDLCDLAFSENSTSIGEKLSTVRPTECVCKDKPCLKVVYIQPDQCLDEDGGIVIDFKTFAKTIEKGESKGIRRMFACYLKEWVAAAESRKPGNLPSC